MPSVSPLIRELLTRRGFIEEKDVEAFLRPQYEAHTHDPNLFANMDAATERMLAAIKAGERIAIYADFDCDGIPGAAVLSDLFQKIGYENFEVYLPHRDREGYGFHTEAIDQLATSGVKLIITVDVGTSAVDAVAHAKRRDVDVIVTDHHEITGELPDAIAVLNPKRAPYPFPGLCGAGVAFKFAQALIAAGKAREIEGFLGIATGWEKWLLDLVAIATVADMVPLIGENRALTYWGLMVLRKSPRPGLAALFSKLRLRRDQITEEDIGFSIAPRINAASRMDSPDLAFKLLTTKDRDEAQALALKLEELNASRKGVVGSIVREARKRVQERFSKEQNVIVLGDPEWKPALLGLAANSIMGERGGVVCLWGRDAVGRIKGSCRSDGGLSVVELFSGASESFEEFGGHSASGGFTVAENAVHALHESLTAAAAALVQTAAEAGVSHDAAITLRQASSSLWRELAALAPFGVGNPKPVLRLESVRVGGSKRFGKEKNHIELTLECVETGTRVRAYDFFRGPDGFSFLPGSEELCTVLATIERDSFRGGVALRLLDVLPA